MDDSARERPWIWSFEQDGLNSLRKIIPLILEDSSLMSQKINCKYNVDATNVSISAYVPQWQLEDNVFQQGENDTGVILGLKYDNSIYVGLTNLL